MADVALTPEEYETAYRQAVAEQAQAETVDVPAEVPAETEYFDETGTQYYYDDSGAPYYYDETGTAQYYDAAATGPAGGIGSIPAILILGLFAFLVWRGATSNSGSVCGRPWLAMLALSTAAAVSFSLMKNAFSSREPMSAYDELSKGTSFFPKVFGSAAPGVAAGPSLALSMIPFALFLALFQYLITVLLLFFQKPRAGISEILRKSFIAAGISFLMSAIFIVLFLVLSNIPIFRAILTVGTRLPFVGSLIENNAHFLLAWNPLAILSGITAFGISCAATNEPPPQ